MQNTFTLYFRYKTTQWLKEKEQKNKQKSTKQT